MKNQSSLPLTTKYAPDSTYIESPTNQEWLDGVEPGYTLPAKWWNYLMQLMTETNVTAKSDINSVLNELKSVLTAASITVDPGVENQLLAAINQFLALKANLDSPSFTGTPSLPTGTIAVKQAVDNNTTAVATTSFVLSQAAATAPLAPAVTAVIGTSTRFARMDHVHPTNFTATATDIKMDGTQSVGALTTFPRADHVHPTDTSRAPTSHASAATTYGVASASNYGHALAGATSPAANGTAAVGTDNGKFARDGHVHPANFTATATDIKMDGTQSVGALTTFPRADHVHPTDTSRAPTVSPTFTGTVTVPVGVNPTDAVQKSQLPAATVVSSPHRIVLSGVQTYNWTCPVGVTKILLTACGAGGNAASLSINSGSGGAGSWCRDTVITVVPGTVYTFTLSNTVASTITGSGFSTVTFGRGGNGGISVGGAGGTGTYNTGGAGAAIAVGGAGGGGLGGVGNSYGGGGTAGPSGSIVGSPGPALGNGYLSGPGGYGGSGMTIAAQPGGAGGGGGGGNSTVNPGANGGFGGGGGSPYGNTAAGGTGGAPFFTWNF